MQLSPADCTDQLRTQCTMSHPQTQECPLQTQHGTLRMLRSSLSCTDPPRKPCMSSLLDCSARPSPTLESTLRTPLSTRHCTGHSHNLCNWWHQGHPTGQQLSLDCTYRSVHDQRSSDTDQPHRAHKPPWGRCLIALLRMACTLWRPDPQSIQVGTGHMPLWMLS